MIQFSVLICTYNRPMMLVKALSALIDGTTEKPDEIVVVNGGDQEADRVVRLAEERAALQGIALKLVSTVNVNLATSRNIGLSCCSGELVAMTDDDAEVFPDWVDRMKCAHREHPEAGAVGGAVFGTASSQSLVSRLSDLVTFPSQGEEGYVRTLPGVNVSYKKTVLTRIGLQDVTLFRGEDVDFNWRVQEAGYKVLFDPTIRVHHHHRPSMAQFIHQHYMYGRAYHLVRKKWPNMYCVYPRGIHSGRDVLKAIHFFVAALYEPFLHASRLPRWFDRIAALPIFMVNQFAWRGGMIVQKLIGRSR
jgi:GT2 family glycosyltransferase